MNQELAHLKENGHERFIGQRLPFEQGGDQAFYRMHDLLFDNQRDLSRATLESHARAIGLDLAVMAAWGVGAMIVALRFFSWEPRGLERSGRRSRGRSRRAAPDA